jgi:hypothetical protein
MRVGSGGVVLEGIVVIVILTDALRLAAAGAGRRLVAVEPAPGDPLGIQQIADIFAGHLNRRAGRAVICSGVDVGDDTAVYHFAGDSGGSGTMGLS